MYCLARKQDFAPFSVNAFNHKILLQNSAQKSQLLFHVTFKCSCGGKSRERRAPDACNKQNTMITSSTVRPTELLHLEFELSSPRLFFRCGTSHQILNRPFENSLGDKRRQKKTYLHHIHAFHEEQNPLPPLAIRAPSYQSGSPTTRGRHFQSAI